MKISVSKDRASNPEFATMSVYSCVAKCPRCGMEHRIMRISKTAFTSRCLCGYILYAEAWEDIDNES